MPLKIRAALLVVLVCSLALTPTSVLASSAIYYFKGDPTDQTNKVVNDVGTATFDTTAPTGTVPITQTGSAFANDDFVGNGLAFYWSGPFSGPATGTLDLQWYWSSQAASAVGGFVDITVFADPDYNATSRVQPQKIIGRALTPLVGIGAAPTLVHSQIPVSGSVTGTLLIQAVPHFLVNDAELFAHYGATSTPSRFQILDVARTPFPVAPLGTGPAPRFKALTPSAAQLAAGIGTDAGEPSIGVNWFTGSALFQSFVTTFRASFDDSCPTTPSATWINKASPITSVTSLDPILFTDRGTGRTFVSQLLLNPIASSSAFSDNDGETWIPSQGSGIGSGVDHQTIGGGPFHAPLSGTAAYSNAVYYCSQDIAAANCAVSLDGGATYGPAVPIYAGSCVGLHGHVKVGPDGTAYVPNKGCGENQAVIVSEDNGITWNIRKVPGSLGADSDPSVAVSSGGRVYLGFADNNNDPVVAVSDDRGKNWYNVQNVAPGIRNVVFSEMVAGDDNRAAFAFLGTTTPGHLTVRTFPGVWHIYISTTYDGGKSWIPVNATPNDPVQRGPIWLSGGAEISRNLLDFNDATIDKNGRILVALADGCIGACSQAQSTARGNAYTAVATIVRQAGGRRLFSQYDPPEPTAPGAPTLTVTRNGALAKLTWSQANDGGSPVTNYAVYRRSGTSAPALVANAGSATAYTDATADVNTTYTWSVTATNAVGSSCGSNDVTAQPAGSSCASGVVVVTDASGDQAGAPANAALDIQSVSIAEPYYADGSQKLFFTIKVASLASLPPASEWRVIWNFPTGASGQYYADMRTDANSIVSFQYGRVAVTGAVVTSVGQPVKLGNAEPESSYSADGTIRIVLLNSKLTTAAADAGPVAGDLIGGLVGRTYAESGTQATTGRAAADSTRIAATYALVGNNFCAPPVITCLEDDDTRIAYSNAWHRINDPNASAGHFRLGTGNVTASLTFTVPANQYGALTYNYAKSPKGGTAQVFIDGVSQATMSFYGTTGTMRAPQFGFSQRFGGLQPGTHTFEIRSVNVAYVDGFCLESSSSNAQPASGPGTTSSSTSTLAVAQELISQIALPANAQAISVAAEAANNALVKIVLVDPTGLAVATSDTSSGLAVINQTVTPGAVYLLKTTNLSAGPVDVWTAVTPLVSR